MRPENGYAHVGPCGAGHFVKMVHNGIEYAMLQAYGEGFDILQAGPFALDLHQLAQLWNQGSVVRSWLLELAERAFADDPKLSKIRGYVDDSGEGRWTVLEAINEDVPSPAIALSLFARFSSRRDDSFAMKVIAALRNEFGGHQVKAAMRLQTPAAQDIVIVGASGDLSRRKLLPALYNLAAAGLLPARGDIVGFARTDLGEAGFREFARQAVQEFSRTGLDEEAWNELRPRLSYIRHGGRGVRAAQGASPTGATSRLPGGAAVDRGGHRQRPSTTPTSSPAHAWWSRSRLETTWPPRAS